DRRAAFAAEQEEQLGVSTIAAPSAEAAVRGADIVVTVTTSQSPVLQADWVEPHALVAAIGSNYRNRAEVPAELVERAQTVVVDRLPQGADLEPGTHQKGGHEDHDQCCACSRVNDPRRWPGGGKTDHHVRPVRAAPGFPGFNGRPDHPADVCFGGRVSPA